MRRVTARKWKRLESDPSASIEGALDDLRYGMEDGAISVFETPTEREIELVAVAMAGMSQDKLVYYVHITNDDTVAIDGRVSTSLGRTPIPDANALHRDLSVTDSGLNDLVVRIRSREEKWLRVFKKARLRELARPYLDRDDVTIAPDHWLRRSA
jgi:hypothetical protein